MDCGSKGCEFDSRQVRMEGSHSGQLHEFRKLEGQPYTGSNPVPSAFDRRSDLRRTMSANREGDPFTMWYVYILLCSDNKPYTGCTNNWKERLEKHGKGFVPATKYRLPAKLVSYFTFLDKYKAFEFEEYLKSGSGRAFLKKHLL